MSTNASAPTVVALSELDVSVKLVLVVWLSEVLVCDSEVDVVLLSDVEVRLSLVCSRKGTRG